MEGFKEAQELTDQFLTDLVEAKRLMAECIKNLILNEVYLKECYFWKNYRLGVK